MPKSPETQQARTDAVNYVIGRLTNEAGRAFPHINEVDFTGELLERILHPKKINQGGLGFCGPAAVLYALAKDDIQAYAQLAVDLFTTGTATVRGWRVDAGFLTNEQPPLDAPIECCDWMMMACIRKNVGFGALTAISNLAHGAYPFEIKTSLENLGYGNVKNETCTGIFGSAGMKNFHEAVMLLQTDFRVILCVNGNMFKNPSAAAGYPNHFCTLKSVEELTQTVKIRVWQWGKDNKEPATAGASVYVNLPQADFLKHYFGYVAGGDLQ
jgi:hypothetical protein